MKDTKRSTDKQDFCELRASLCSCQAGVCFLRTQYQNNFLRLSESPHSVLTYAVFRFLKDPFNEPKTCGHEVVIGSHTGVTVKQPCEVWGFHSGVTEDTDLL
jgi:hypothetical protein